MSHGLGWVSMSCGLGWVSMSHGLGKMKNTLRKTTQHRGCVCSKWIPQGDVEKIYGTKTATDRQSGARRTRESWGCYHTILERVIWAIRRIANWHSFRAAFRPGRKVKESKHTCQEPLGERQKCVVYKIPDDSQSAVYVGETWYPFPDKKERACGQTGKLAPSKKGTLCQQRNS